MFSKSVAVGLLAVGCVAAAAGGAYVAVRQNAEPAAAAAVVPVPAQADAVRPVAETEAVVAAEPTTPASDASSRAVVEAPRATQPIPENAERPARARQTARRAAPRPVSQPGDVTADDPGRPSPSTSSRDPREPAAQETPPAPPAAPVEPAAPPAPQLEQIVVPASSVVGLRVESPVSSERARIEDRVDARVTRDVMADGRVAIPEGARAIGSVTLVERGGKVKERARLGVRFHTLVLADGTELPISTEAIYREGEAPSGESARKIGGAAVGGAILGALIGGKKGAIVGGATGAAGGTAVVMAGDRNAATLPAGTVVTIRLAAPVGVEVEKR